MDIRTFIVPVANRTMVEEQIEKLNRRAQKLDLDLITLAWGKAYVDTNNHFVIPCDISGPLSVCYNGWQFVATLQHLPTGENIIRAISDEFVIPLEYRASGSACEHCRVDRYRKDTYVVRHESGIYNQVGSTCIKDFLGGNSPDNIMKRANLVGELVSFMEGMGNGPYKNDEGIIPIIRFLEQTSACIRDYGWLSKTNANETGGIATVSRVKDHFVSPDNLDKKSLVTSEDQLRAKNALEWAENISDDYAEVNEYLYNIRAIARSGMVGIRTMGYSASIVSSYDRELKKQELERVSDYVGELKKRDNFDLTLKSVKSGVSDYGAYYKYIFRDIQGNVVVWNSSVNHELKENKLYAIRGTVKSHTEWQGKKQTNITRCEILTTYN